MFKKILYSIRYLSWLTPFGAFVIGYYGSYTIRQKSVICTPNLIGKNLKQALIAVSDNNLSMSVFAEKDDAILPEGTVLNQVPSPNQKVRPHQNIFVTIAKKPKPHQAPHFLGQKNTEIAAYASQNKKTIKSIALSSRQTRHVCIAQIPEPGKDIGNEKVVVYLSAGQSTLYIVPDFKGALLGRCQECLKTLAINSEVFTPNNEVLSEQDGTCWIIIDQKPMAGSLVDLGKPLYVQLQVERVDKES